MGLRWSIRAILSARIVRVEKLMNVFFWGANLIFFLENPGLSLVGVIYGVVVRKS